VSALVDDRAAVYPGALRKVQEYSLGLAGLHEYKMHLWRELLSEVAVPSSEKPPLLNEHLALPTMGNCYRSAGVRFARSS
jgi:hypothetical protein